LRRIKAMVRRDRHDEGYRDVWRQGPAAEHKKRQRLFGRNRPST